NQQTPAGRSRRLSLLAGILLMGMPPCAAADRSTVADDLGVPVLLTARPRPGTLDQSFGAIQPGYSFTGWVTTTFPAPPSYTPKASVRALAIAPDGKIVAAGWASNISPTTPVVARY